MRDILSRPPKKESEKTLERRLAREIDKRGGMCLKWHSGTYTGMPDRVILMMSGRTYFAELKSTGKTISPRQRHVIERLRAIGHKVHIIDSTETLTRLLTEIDSDNA